MRILVVPSTETSDVAELARESDVVVGFAYGAEASGKIMMRLSLRSRGGFDCASFCDRLGGGGHRNAAGASFELPSDAPNPYAVILTLFENLAP